MMNKSYINPKQDRKSSDAGPQGTASGALDSQGFPQSTSAATMQLQHQSSNQSSKVSGIGSKMQSSGGMPHLQGSGTGHHLRGGGAGLQDGGVGRAGRDGSHAQGGYDKERPTITYMEKMHHQQQNHGYEENYSARSQNKQQSSVPGSSVQMSVQMSAKQGSRDRRIERTSAGLTGTNSNNNSLTQQQFMNYQGQDNIHRAGLGHTVANASISNRGGGGLGAGANAGSATQSSSLFNTGAFSKHQKQLSTQIQDNQGTQFQSKLAQKDNERQHLGAKIGSTTGGGTFSLQHSDVINDQQQPLMSKQQSLDQATHSAVQSNRLNQIIQHTTPNPQPKMKSGFSTSRNTTTATNSNVHHNQQQHQHLNGSTAQQQMQSSEQHIHGIMSGGNNGAGSSMTLKNQRAMSKGLRAPLTLSNTVGSRLSNNSMIAQGSVGIHGFSAGGHKNNPDSIISLSNNQISKVRLSPKNSHQQSSSGKQHHYTFTSATGHQNQHSTNKQQSSSSKLLNHHLNSAGTNRTSSAAYPGAHHQSTADELHHSNQTGMIHHLKFKQSTHTSTTLTNSNSAAKRQMMNKSRGRGRAPQGAAEVYEGEQLEEREGRSEGDEVGGEDGGMGAGGGLGQVDGGTALGDGVKGAERGQGSVSGDPGGVIQGRDGNLDERTQVEVENTRGITVMWFLKRLVKIKKMNNSYDAQYSQFDIDSTELKQLIPIHDCTDDTIMARELDTEFQRTIKVDSQRTRVSEMKGLHALSLKLNQRIFNLDEANLRTEKALTYFQIHRKTPYIQGPNEILGPFMWLAHKDKIFDEYGNSGSRFEQQLIQNPLTTSLQAMHLFMDTFLPTMFLDDNFVCLQSCFCLLRLLLKYHDPAVCNVLSSNQVDPQLYAMRWFFTMFAQQCERVDIVLDLWSRMLQDKSESFGGFNSPTRDSSGGQWWKRRGILNLSLALIIMNRENILTCDRSELFGLMTNLSIKNKKQIDQLFQNAEEIYKNTPISFWESPEMNILFGENSQTHYMSQLTPEDRVQMHLRLENYQCIPITNSEFFKNIDPDFADHMDDFYSTKRQLVGPPRYHCPNPKCFRFHEIQVALKQEQLLQEKLRNDETDQEESLWGLPKDLKQIQERYAKHLSETCQQIFAPYSSDLSFHFVREFQNNQFQNNIQNHLDQVLIQLQKGPLLIGSLKDHMTAMGITPQSQQSDHWVVLEQNGSQQAFSIKQNELINYYKDLGIDIKNITQNTRFPDGPSFAELCEDCKINRMSIDSEKQNQNLRLIIMDCRALMLQKEAMLPGSMQFEITNSCDKRNLLNQVRQRFEDCKDQVHICLLGLNPQDVPRDYKEANDFIGQSNFGQSPISNKQTNSQADDNLDIRDFHDKVLKFIIEMFYRESFKYISFLPGGFEQCHQFIKTENATILHQYIEKLLDQEDQFMRDNQIPKPQKNTNQLPHFFELIDPHYQNNCYHCAMELTSCDPQANNFLESQTSSTRLGVDTTLRTSGGTSRVSLQTPNRGAGGGNLQQNALGGQQRRGTANYSGMNHNNEAADIESSISSGQQKPNSSVNNKDTSDFQNQGGSNVVGGQQVKQSHLNRFASHLTGGQRFGRGNNQQVQQQAHKTTGNINTFEISKAGSEMTDGSSQKYNLEVFKIQSNYGPIGGNNINSSIVSTQQNYNNLQYGFSTSEFDPSNEYLESEGNQPHPQPEGNLDIFSGFRNWWHVNITNNSKLLGGFGLGDHHGHGGLKGNHGGRRANNASSPTTNLMVDAQKGGYGKSGKGHTGGQEGMQLLNMTQITRSDIRSKQQKIRDSNSNSNIQIASLGGAVDSGDFQRENPNNLLFNDSNQQSSSEYPSHNRDVTPQTVFSGKQMQQNFNISMSNNHNRHNDNLSGRQNHLRTSNISDQQRKMMRPGQQTFENQKVQEKKKGQFLQQKLNNNLLGNNNNYHSSDTGDFNNTNNESSQYVSFGQDGGAHQIQHVSTNELPMHIHATGRNNNMQNSPSPPRQAMGNHITKMNEYRTSMHGVQNSTLNSNSYPISSATSVLQPQSMRAGTQSNTNSMAPNSNSQQLHFQHSHQQKTNSNQNFLPQAASSGTRTHYQHHKSEHKGHSFFDQDLESGTVAENPGAAHGHDEDDELEHHRIDNMADDADPIGTQQQQPQDRGLHRSGQHDYEYGGTGSGGVYGQIREKEGARGMPGNGGYSFQEKPGVGGLRIANQKQQQQSVDNQREVLERNNVRGIQGRHPSVSNEKNKKNQEKMQRLGAANEIDGFERHKKSGTDRGQSAVAVGGRSRIGGITDKILVDPDRLSTDQKLAHKGIHRNENSHANISKVNNFMNMSVGNNNNITENKGKKGVRDTDPKNSHDRKDTDRLSKQKEELKNLVSSSLQGKGGASKDPKQLQSRKSGQGQPTATGITAGRGPNSKLTTSDPQSIPPKSDGEQQQKNKSQNQMAQTSIRESQASSQFQLEERSYYLCNGIQKQQSYEGWHDDVKRIIEVDAKMAPNDIVIYHVKRLASSHLQQLIQHQQMIQTSQSQQQSQASSTPGAGSGSGGPVVSTRIFGHDSKNPSITSIIITQYTTVCLCQAFSFIQSRFFMHDLIKITSRKSSAKIITFYFRIPQFGEYNANYYKTVELNEDENGEVLQQNTILSTYNQNPNIPYQFAYKRKKYHEVKMGFEFKTEEEARDCIERVSILYKRLKNSYKEDANNNNNNAQGPAQAQTQKFSGSTSQEPIQNSSNSTSNLAGSAISGVGDQAGATQQSVSTSNINNSSDI